MEIDLEILIILVYDLSNLWDKIQSTYKDRILTRNTWIEIFKQQSNEFEETVDKETNDYKTS